VGPLTTFTPGTTARASEVNGNFSTVKISVDDNHSRISLLETNAASPNITGNITLVPSTATTGNILKGAARFIHNFGTNNSFIGENAGNFTMTGDANTASGAGALQSNTTGKYNAASGYHALHSNTTGEANAASGAQALSNNTTGLANTASGGAALYYNTIGTYNTASGHHALANNTTGNDNTAVGAGALFGNETGTNNIAIGRNAGLSLTTGSSNIAIGNAGVAGEATTIRIGSVQTRAFIAGIRGVTTSGADAVAVVVDSSGQLGTVSSSRRVKENIADMDATSSALMKLRPVTFHDKNDKNPRGRTLQYGLVAEEVAKVAPGLVARSADGQIETVYYQFLAPMLLNEYQKQQRIIEVQGAELSKQRLQIAELRQQAARIVELEKQVARMTAVLGHVERAGMIATAVR